MADDRYNRDPRRNDYNVDNRRSNSSSSQNEDRAMRNPGSDWFRDDDNRRDYGGSGNFYGSNRDDYGSRDFQSHRNYGGGQNRSDSDEWSRRGNRSFDDRYQTYDANRLDIGNQGRDRDNDRTYGGYDRSAYGGDRFGSSDSRDYGNRSGSHRSTGGGSYGGGERGYAQGGRGLWDKASDEVSSWFGDRDAENRREQDQHRGRGPKNYSRSDDRIRDDINDRLTDDNYLDASDIEVSVKDREVTLSGTVSDRNAKRRAEDVAESISGVSHVQNNIRVKSNTGTGSSTSASSAAATGSTAASGSSTTSVDVDRSNTLSGGLGGRIGSTGTSGAGS